MSSDDHKHDLVVIATFTLPGEAEVAASFLDAHGIASIVNRPFVSGLRPNWSAGLAKDRGVRLEVRSEDAEAARDLLDSAEMENPDST